MDENWEDQTDTTTGYYWTMPSHISWVNYETQKTWYTFTWWTPAFHSIIWDETYTAKYDESLKYYSITWVDWNWNELKTDYVAYGVTPVYNWDIPTKTATAKTWYTFNNTWNITPYPVTGNETYIAQFDESINKYVISFYDEDDSFLWSWEYDYWTTTGLINQPVAVKNSDWTYSYSFDKCRYLAW